MNRVRSWRTAFNMKHGGREQLWDARRWKSGVWPVRSVNFAWVQQKIEQRIVT